MNRNIAIVIFILILVVLAAYFAWLRSRFSQGPAAETTVIQMTPTPAPIEVSSPSASLAPQTASPSATPKEASTAATKAPTPAPTKTASPSAQTR